MIRTLAALSLIWLCQYQAKAQPSLALTTEAIERISVADNLPPLFEAALSDAEKRVTRSIGEGIIVPMPKDPGGGYTHERHKENYKVIKDAGILYRLTGRAEFLAHAEKILHAYADMYKELPLHPKRKNQAPGRLFWQSLNESVWLVYVAQGYDAIRDDLSEASRERIERELLRPVAEFLSTGSRSTFQRIHNHGTWAAAAVGMTGYALNDESLVERALYGLDGDGSAGYLKQLDELFSPDGYYTEGPYYQRYALMPFILFAQTIEDNEPERRIFAYRDGILEKAITATIQQSYAGRFFPINDAIKEKGLDTKELVYGVAIAFGQSSDPGLLSIAEEQGITVLTNEGFQLARALYERGSQAFEFKTQILRDGSNGDQGGLAVLRLGEGPMSQALVAKHTGQGMGHGHFDKLSLLLYDNGDEILTDYGAARFLNVPSKEGGRYLPENTTWAKQSVAHNTIVLGGESHFGGDWKRGQESWPTIDFFESSERVNVIAATVDDAYPDAVISRTTFQVLTEKSDGPIIIDVADVQSAKQTSIDVPYYFSGQLTDSSLQFVRSQNSLKPLGTENGYQHLWCEATTQAPTGSAHFTWLTGTRFYSYHSLSSEPGSFTIVRTGANDPDFNLRNEPGIIFRINSADEAQFISVFEGHGLYDAAQEITRESESRIASIATSRSSSAQVIVLSFKEGGKLAIGLANEAHEGATHTVLHDGRSFTWDGYYAVFE
ncbi:MAG: alginate lyase family protein [Pseudomonadota bacterium]